MIDWTEARIEILREGVKAGEPYSVVAQRIGCTRNAAIGKALRLGIRQPPSLTVPKHVRVADAGSLSSRNAITAARSRSLGAGPAPEARLPRVVIPFREEAAGTRDVLTIAHTGECRFPIGDPQDPGFTLCGQGTVAGSPYCQGHGLRCFTSAATREWVDRKLGLEPGKRFAAE